MDNAPTGSEDMTLDDLGTLSTKEGREASNEASTVAVAGADGDACAEVANDRLCRKISGSHCLENNHSKKSLLAMRIGLKIDNDVFDFDKIEACMNCKERSKCYPKRANLITEITRRWCSFTRSTKRCKSWKFQRMVDWLQQCLVRDEACV